VNRRALLALMSLSIGACALFHTVRSHPESDETHRIFADEVVIEKSARTLTLFRRGIPLKTYRVALGTNPLGAKHEKGDGRTPEGRYVIDFRYSGSTFHRSLHVSYPGEADRAWAREKATSAGGDIMIHGIRNGLGWLGPLHRTRDWTLGCIAVTDAEIEEIWNAVPNGTPVEILP